MTLGEVLSDLRTRNTPLERAIYSADQAEVPEAIRRFLVRGADAVVQPRSEAEILEVLQAAAREGVPVVPRGAASSPYGGVLPARGGIVLDLSLLRQILALEREPGIVTVEAGVRWADLDEFLRGNGYALRSHPSSWFSTVAGWLSTGGYGMFSLGFGPFWRQVEWIRVVDFDGVRTLLRDALEFPYHVHTEGQMGVVSQVGLRARPRPDFQRPLLFTFPSAGEALATGQVVAQRHRPVHMTFYDPARLREFNALQGRDILEEAPSLLMVVEEEAQLDGVLADAHRRGTQADHYRASYLWEHRLFPMQVKRLGPGLLGSEVLLGTHALPGYVARANEVAAAFGVHLSHEAHFVSPHQALAISAFLTDPNDLAGYLPHLGLVLRLTREGIRLGGRAYGLGLWNRPFLATRYTRREFAALRRQKRQVDPQNLLNPGKALGGPPLLMPWMLGAPVLSPGLFRVAGRALAALFPPAPPPAEAPPPEDVRAAAECAHCSACITVCPAYLADRTELVTARGKLMALQRLATGETLAERDALKLFDCIHCSACTNVCQSAIDLVPVWDRLEDLVARRYGKPVAQIEDFARRVEEEPEYHDLVRKGLAYPLQTPVGSYKRV